MPCELKGFRGLDISKEVFWFSRKPFWVRFGPLLPKAKAGTLVDRRVLALYSKAKAGTCPLRGCRSERFKAHPKKAFSRTKTLLSKYLVL